MISLIRPGSRVMRSRVFQVRLSNAFARSAGARSALIIVFRARLSGARLLPLVGTSTPMPALRYPLSVRVLRPVRGRDADLRVTGQDPDICRVLVPAQHQNRLHERCRRSLPRTGVVTTTVRGEPPRHAVHRLLGDIEGCTIGNHVGSCSGLGSGRTNPSSQGPTPTAATPRPTSSVTRVTDVTLRRKPHWVNINKLGVEVCHSCATDAADTTSTGPPPVSPTSATLPSPADPRTGPTPGSPQ